MMRHESREWFSLVVDTLSKMNEVQSVGKSGGEALPESGESDIDLFVFCDAVPDREKREAAVKALGNLVREYKVTDYDGVWGVCDFLMLNGLEVFLMYFSTSRMDAEIESVLRGERMEKEENYFYPTGRCATFLTMHILLDKNGYIAKMKQKLSEYPADLSRRLMERHIYRLNANGEDFERAVSRNDVLFYHVTLDNSIDHFLQALFAANKVFFPSRKRTMQYLERFKIKPADCAGRLLRAVELGAKPETLSESYALWSELCKDFLDMLDAERLYTPK